MKDLVWELVQVHLVKSQFCVCVWGGGVMGVVPWFVCICVGEGYGGGVRRREGGGGGELLKFCHV